MIRCGRKAGGRCARVGAAAHYLRDQQQDEEAKWIFMRK
jgi:hypothetical protein